MEDAHIAAQRAAEDAQRAAARIRRAEAVATALVPSTSARGPPRTPAQLSVKRPSLLPTVSVSVSYISYIVLQDSFGYQILLSFL